jgi:hypothetical protein
MVSVVYIIRKVGKGVNENYRTGAGKEELDLEERREQDRWNSLSTSEKIRDVAARHEYSIIGGAWATSLAGSFGYIMRDPHQTFAQKVRSFFLSCYTPLADVRITDRAGTYVGPGPYHRHPYHRWRHGALEPDKDVRAH